MSAIDDLTNKSNWHIDRVLQGGLPLLEYLPDLSWGDIDEAAAELAAMKEQLDKAVAWHEGDDSPHARLEQTIAALRAENKNHRDMNLLMNDTNNRLRSEIKQTRAENGVMIGEVNACHNELAAKDAALEEARDIMQLASAMGQSIATDWLSAHPKEGEDVCNDKRGHYYIIGGFCQFCGKSQDAKTGDE